MRKALFALLLVASSALAAWPPGLLITPHGSVTVSGETITQETTSPLTPSARLEFRTDGTVWKIVTPGPIETQLDSATDWEVPRKGGMIYFEIRFTNLVGTAPDSSTVAEDAWHPFTDGEFAIEYSRLTFGSDSATFDIEIRFRQTTDTNPVLDSGSYTMTITMNP